MPKLLFTLLLCFICICSPAQTANRYDVVITEIMADPSPVVTLPNAEYLELKNLSANPVNLNGWKISDATTTATINTSFILQPDSFVIICSNSNVAAFNVFGRTIGVSNFPSLDNDGDEIVLRSPQNLVIHSVSYTSAWYQNPVKTDGGWSLEMSDTKNPCAGMNNWKASTDNSGGTPGRKNSVDGVVTDNIAPELKNAFLINNTTIILNFTEPIDSISASAISNYTINPSVTISAAIPINPSLTSVQINLGSPLNATTVYSITASNIVDCKGNKIGNGSVKFGIPQDAMEKDIVINEILFNPKSSGYDFLEFYNGSNKIIDANKLYIGNRNGSGVVSSLKKLSETFLYIFPGEYVVVTEDAANLALQYFVSNSNAVIEISSLPSFPDDEGDVVLVNLNNVIIDEVKYSDDWHFALLSDKEGISLERIDPDGESNNKSNWHSAASTAGYATPGYKNSQYKQSSSIKALIETSPKIFSPDNDGTDDVATIQYQLSESGFVTNVFVFDAAGRQVRHLVKNATLGLKGSWTWDGLNEKAQKLPIGTYIIYTELFNLQGKKEKFRNTIVLARRLN